MLRIMLYPADGALAAPGSNGCPAGSGACWTCNHSARLLIEELMRAGVSDREIVRWVRAMGIWCPSHRALGAHRRNHLLSRKQLDRIRDAQGIALAAQG
jgi:hypothetical protein